MKKIAKLMVPVVALALGMASCDKSNTTTTPTTPPTTTTPTTPSSPTPVTPTPNTSSGFWGILIGLRMDFAYSNPQLPIPVSVATDMGIASLYSQATTGNGSAVDAGKVQLNSNELTNNNNSYTVTATTGMTPSSLNLDNGCKWEVAGNGSVNGFTYNYSGAHPEYTGSSSLPTTIDRSKDLQVSLGSKVKNADSVYVVIVTSSKQIIKAYSANPAPATVTVKASELSGLPAVSDNTAYLEIVPFKYDIATLNGKGYVFIKEYAGVTAVTIN